MFMHWTISEDVETQRKGLVVLAWITHEGEEDKSLWEQVIRPGMGKDLRAYKKKEMDAIPVRVASLQQYYKDTPFFRALSALYVFGLNSYHRSIYKVHFGA